MEERSELARKFKYYHKSVRPSERLNVIETVNGTFFALNAEVEILQSKVAAVSTRSTQPSSFHDHI